MVRLVLIAIFLHLFLQETVFAAAQCLGVFEKNENPLGVFRAIDYSQREQAVAPGASNKMGFVLMTGRRFGSNRSEVIAEISYTTNGSNLTLLHFSENSAFGGQGNYRSLLWMVLDKHPGTTSIVTSLTGPHYQTYLNALAQGTTAAAVRETAVYTQLAALGFGRLQAATPMTVGGQEILRIRLGGTLAPANDMLAE